MLLGDIGSQIGGWLRGAASGFSGAFPYIVGAIAMGVAIWWFTERQSYTKKIKLMKLVGNRTATFFDKAKRVNAKDGVPYWKLKKYKIDNRKILPTPPDNAKELLGDGTEYAECYVTESGQVIWKQDTFDLEEYMKDNKEEVEELTVDGETRKVSRYTGFKPISTTERAAYAHQIENAKKYTENFWKDNAGLLIGGGTVLLMFIVMVVFFGDIAGPAIQMQEQVNQRDKIQLQQLETLQKIDEGVSILLEEEVNQGTRPTNNSTGGGG